MPLHKTAFVSRNLRDYEEDISGNRILASVFGARSLEETEKTTSPSWPRDDAPESERLTVIGADRLTILTIG